MKTVTGSLSPHVFLRQQTRREHAAAENTAAMRALFDDRFDLFSYVSLLQGYHSLYREWEDQHAVWLRGGLASAGWLYRSRLPALEDDLNELGMQPVALACADDSDRLVAASEAWGCLYVIEGSALGGQVIARKLAKTFPDHAHRFFNLGHGNAHPSWKDFQAMLDISLADSSARRVAVAQARTMFDLFHSMLETLSADAMAMPGQLPTRDLRTQAVDRLSGS